ncbi:MAG TPA: hypothetical protein VM325_06705 [Alphaproteobacteria bacterium]|nr:hypothetical protein [Alphaproteobacteria bacterium]
MHTRSAVIAAALALGLAAGPAGAQSNAALLAKYPVKQVYTGKPAPVNLKSHKNARNFRTLLRAAALRGPKFAGRYAVAQWGCGTSCQQLALIDARTGRVTFGPSASHGARYRLRSRLLIVNAEEDIRDAWEARGQKRPDWAKTEYYLWRGGKLVKIARP